MVSCKQVAAKIDPWATKIFLRSLSYGIFTAAPGKAHTPQSIIKRSRKNLEIPFPSYEEHVYAACQRITEGPAVFLR